MKGDSLRPMLATPGSLDETTGGWAFEFKWDGMRALAENGEGGLRLVSRNGNDIRATFPELAPLHGALGRRNAVVDGEIVAFDDAGRPDFGLLQQRMHLQDVHVVRMRAARTPVVYVVFDVLRLDGVDLTGRPYAERRVALESLGLNGPHWITPGYHVDAGAALLEVSRSRGIEGIVAKRLNAPYRPGVRTRDWLKIKNVLRQEFVVGGWTDGQGTRRGTIGALLVGYYEGERLVFAGSVGTGFDEATLADLFARLERLGALRSPFEPAPRLIAPRWVLPELVVEVGFRAWTHRALVRHAVYKGLRMDMDPREVVLERPLPEVEVMAHA